MIPYYHSLRPETLTGGELDQLLELGWYRMHQNIFTCSHIEHNELYRVHWLRYAVAEIKQHSSHKRIRSRAKKFQHTVEDAAVISLDHRELHARYRVSIDFDGALSIEECLFGGYDLEHNIYNTKCISIFDAGKLVAAGYFDVGAVSGTSILHFFDPEYSRYSLGKYLILLTIDYLSERGYAFYYPGYLVEGLPKMNYKLFLGKEEAQYFDPEAISWKYFDERILTRQPDDGNQLASY